jgi:predicted dehydrogenase
MKRIGLMGCGTVAGYGHLPAIAACPALELAALFEPDAERRAAASDRFGAPGFADVDAFFDQGLDAVAITSPAPYHAANAEAAVRHGTPILCEKPLAMDEAEARRMKTLAEEAGVPLYTAFTYRFGPEALRIRDLVLAGAVGPVRALRLVYIWNVHGKFEAGTRVEQKRRAGRMHEGGPMVDCGAHQVDLARWWLGAEAVRWHGVGAWVDEYEAPDHMWLHMDHAGGAHTMVEISYSYCHTAAEPEAWFTYELIGAEGVIRYDRQRGDVVVRSSSGTETYPAGRGKDFAGMYAEFARALDAGGSDLLASADDGIMATRITREATAEAIAGRLRT